MSNTDLIQSIAHKNAAAFQSAQQSLSSKGSADSAQSVGKAMAFQMVSQATGMLVEDAASFLRNVMEINLAIVSVASYEYVKSDGVNVIWLTVIKEAFKVIEQATVVFTTISKAAGETLSQFPA
ncbi:hypothetical protein [Gimesia aquarii]|uniref:Uncharacterized protein n=1 Tax=Gimesia aquarii TaxID=2527964 RepID=A0A517VV17_9PLAN|nr:hypothetical protein [Gimesia aquarii]QDT96843.1 hypothetical protein V144x_23010 [Gimesia aquarii]